MDSYDARYTRREMPADPALREVEGHYDHALSLIDDLIEALEDAESRLIDLEDRVKELEAT